MIQKIVMTQRKFLNLRVQSGSSDSKADDVEED